MKLWDIEIIKQINEPIEAETEEEAIEIAMQMFNNEPESIYLIAVEDI